MKTPKNPEVKYRNELNTLVSNIVGTVKSELVPTLVSLQPEYINDAYAAQLEMIFDRMRQMYVGINTNARIVASEFVGNTDTVNRNRFYKSIEDAIGIDLGAAIQNEDLADILVSSTRENVALIRSIPEEYFKKIETIVFTETTQGSSASSMIKQIQKLNNSTHNRAKLIARDQTSKINSVITQQRSQNLGIEEYIWRTAGDDRVRDSHYRNNGKVFRWDDPPKDTGHPGRDIQCRCVAQPIIKV